MLVECIKAFFEPHYGHVLVYPYSGKDPRNVCLLSDRGFNVPVQNEWCFAFQFNISSSAFATFLFADPAKYPEVPPALAHLAESAAGSMRGQTKVTPMPLDDEDALVKYNQLTIFQCKHRVYAAHAAPRLEK